MLFPVEPSEDSQLHDIVLDDDFDAWGDGENKLRAEQNDCRFKGEKLYPNLNSRYIRLRYLLKQEPELPKSGACSPSTINVSRCSRQRAFYYERREQQTLPKFLSRNFVQNWFRVSGRLKPFTWKKETLTGKSISRSMAQPCSGY